MKNATPLIWRNSADRYHLMGSHCATCNTDYFPERVVCPKCRRKGKIDAKQMPTEGKIYSFTEVHAAPTGFEHETPYYIAIIELPNGVKVLTQLVDSPDEKIKIGAQAKMCFRRIFEEGEEGIIAYGFKFKVV